MTASDPLATKQVKKTLVRPRSHLPLGFLLTPQAFQASIRSDSTSAIRAVHTHSSAAAYIISVAIGKSAVGSTVYTPP